VRRIANVPPPPSPGRRDGVDSFLTIAASTVGVVVLGALQHRFVLHVAPTPRRLLVPAIVGLGFGLLLALIRRARARENEALRALAIREAEIAQLNAELVVRVRERTAELQQKRDELLQAQRMELLGRMAGGVAHDLNNILTVLSGCNAAFRSELQALPTDHRAGAESALADAEACLDRARRISQQFVTLGRGRTGQAAPLRLDAVLDEMTPVLARLLGEALSLEVTASRGAVILADRAQIEQLILNLAVNARDAMGPRGRLQIGVERAGDRVRLSVADDGCGMDEATRARIFEPFFTTKAAGHGTGLGLAVVAEVVRRTGARIEVDSAPRKGTCFSIQFPACEVPVAAEPARALPATRRALRVLLVEDDAGVRRLLAATLGAAGHDVVAAASPEEGERLAAASPRPFEAIVSDMIMPGRSGPEMVERLARQGTVAPGIFMSGYPGEEMERRAGAVEGAAVLQKPFSPKVLLDALAGLAPSR
jgi:signal transduction histidine kinase/CheY-like chemotaxis protein